MKTITLSDVDVQTIVDALRIKHALLVNELLFVPQEPVTTITPAAPDQPVAKYGYRKDGTPRNPPGRPRKKK